MRLRRTQQWATCLLAALVLGNGNGLAQQSRTDVVSLQTLIAEALEQNSRLAITTAGTYREGVAIVLFKRASILASNRLNSTGFVS